MEAKEIQIGDWVIFKDKPAQVIILDDWEDEISYFDDDAGGALTFKHKDIKPIPLTEEIVKLNGFEKCSWDLKRWKCNTGFSIDKEDDIFYAYVCGKLNSITYVHELQHLLRFCGLDDLADNFKIG